jgi:preprotein translocase subunit SecE
VSDSVSGAASADSAGVSGAKKSNKKTEAQKRGNIFARIALFVRQIIAELKKVVTPTRSELLNYTLVVIVFVLVCMAFVLSLDYVIGKAVLWVFG